jgi:hypothetical protein
MGGQKLAVTPLRPPTTWLGSFASLRPPRNQLRPDDHFAPPQARTVDLAHLDRALQASTNFSPTHDARRQRWPWPALEVAFRTAPRFCGQLTACVVSHEDAPT